jgi:DNA-binding GntR family transcriptional regulator
MRTGITEGIAGNEAPFNIEVIAMGVMAPTDDIRICLQMEEDIHYIFTKRLVDDKAVFIDESFFPCSLFPDISVDDIVHKSIYDLVDGKAGRKIVKVVQTIEVAPIEADKAAILVAVEGSPALRVHRILVGSDGKPMAYTRLVGSGTKYKMQMEFEGIR